MTVKKVKVIIGVLTIMIMCSWIVGVTSDAGSTVPGTVNDPIVTKSYVDKKDGDVKKELAAQIAALGSGTTGGTSTSQSSGLFVVVSPKAGQKIICGASAEIILRAGKATVIAGSAGDGLADLTSGDDLRAGADVPKQHHLLVSKDDGRGFDIVVDSHILVKGAYTIK